MSVYEQAYVDQLERIATALESIAGSLIDMQSQEVKLPKISGLDTLESLDIRGKPFDVPAHATEVQVRVEDGEIPDDAATLAREAEELLNAAATPTVSRTNVEVGEGEKRPSVVPKINLFHQDRFSIDELTTSWPDDPIIKEYLRKRDLPATSVYETNVLGAAIGIVYKHLPTEMWGTPEAAKQVATFVAYHSEEQ